MNGFRTKQRAPKLTGHNEAMFKDVSRTMAHSLHWVVQTHPCANVATAVFIFTAPPSTVPRSLLRVCSNTVLAHDATNKRLRTTNGERYSDLPHPRIVKSFDFL